MRRSLVRTIVVVAVAGAVASTYIAHGASTTGPSSTDASTPRAAAALREPSSDATPVPVEPQPSEHRPYAVTTEEVVLVDPTRPAPERAGQPGWRRLRTLVLRPADVARRVPLIVFAHGYDTEPETYLALLDGWAAAGYEVAAPELPGSAADLPGAPERDIADQARDLSFVARAVEGRDADTVDATRVIAAGHSDGASAVALVAFNSAYGDDRFTDYLILSGAIPDQVVDGTWGPGPADRRLLVTVGDADEYDNLPGAETLYDSTTVPGALVIVPGGDHQRMYLDDSVSSASLRAVTLEFLDLASRDSNTTNQWQALANGNDFIVRTRAPQPSALR
jgi:hypothetical protein